MFLRVVHVGDSWVPKTTPAVVPLSYGVTSPVPPPQIDGLRGRGQRKTSCIKGGPFTWGSSKVHFRRPGKSPPNLTVSGGRRHTKSPLGLHLPRWSLRSVHTSTTRADRTPRIQQGSLSLTRLGSSTRRVPQAPSVVDSQTLWPECPPETNSPLLRPPPNPSPSPSHSKLSHLSCAVEIRFNTWGQSNNDNETC